LLNLFTFILNLFFTTKSQTTLTCLPTGRVSLRLTFTTNCKQQLPTAFLYFLLTYLRITIVAP
jgi:hypothetical protein